MSCQLVLSTECLTTHITGIWSLSTVYALMSYQKALITECLVRGITGIRSLTTMCLWAVRLLWRLNALLHISQVQGRSPPFMSCQIALSNECFTTHITGIRTLTTVYAFMSCQIALSTECLTINITGIRTHTTVYAFMSCQIAVDWMPYNTYHSYNVALHCVCVDVLSVGS